MDEVGGRLRALRKSRSWTLKDLAERTNLSRSFVSQVERGVSSVSFASLHTLCRALGVSLAEFFDGASHPVDQSLTYQQQHVIHLNDNIAGVTLSDAAISFRFLSTSFPARQYEAMLGEIAPGYDFPPSTHMGEEFGYVLEGRLHLTIGSEGYNLGPGDSYHFASTTPHGYRVEGEDTVRILWVVTVNRFQTRAGVRINGETPGEQQSPDA